MEKELKCVVQAAINRHYGEIQNVIFDIQKYTLDSVCILFNGGKLIIYPASRSIPPASEEMSSRVETIFDLATDK